MRCVIPIFFIIFSSRHNCLLLGNIFSCTSNHGGRSYSEILSLTPSLYYSVLHFWKKIKPSMCKDYIWRNWLEARWEAMKPILASLCSRRKYRAVGEATPYAWVFHFFEGRLPLCCVGSSFNPLI